MHISVPVLCAQGCTCLCIHAFRRGVYMSVHGHTCMPREVQAVRGSMEPAPRASAMQR